MFSPLQPDLVQPTAEEQKLIEAAKKRIAEKETRVCDEDRDEREFRFSWRGALIAMGIASTITLVVGAAIVGILFF